MLVYNMYVYVYVCVYILYMVVGIVVAIFPRLLHITVEMMRVHNSFEYTYNTHIYTCTYTKRHVFFDSILHYQFPFKIRQSLKRMKKRLTETNELKRTKKSKLKGRGRKKQYLLLSFSFSFNARE